MRDRRLEKILRTQQGQFFGKYRGVVVDNVDEKRRGRLQVEVPQVLGRTRAWAMPCVPFAGEDQGFYCLPDKGTGIWVEFEAGDPSYPIWTGCFWKPDAIPQADADPKIKFWKTKKFTFRVDDENGEIRIENEGGSSLIFTAIDITQESSTVIAKASGGKKTELGAVGFNVHDGALEVV